LKKGELVLERAKEDCHRWHKRVGEIPEADLDSMMDQLTAGLAYMHSCGVAHMDMKPHNVLRFSGGHFKIADFGLSCSSFTHDPCAWTLDYRPPEVLRFDIGNYPLPTSVWACESWALGMTFLNLWFPDANCMLCSTHSSDNRRQLRKLNRVFGVHVDQNPAKNHKMETASSRGSQSCSGCSDCNGGEAWSDESPRSSSSSSSSESSDDEEEELELESDEEVLLANPPDTKSILERGGKRKFSAKHWDYVVWYLQADPARRKLIAEPGVSALAELPAVRATKRRWSTVSSWMFRCACGSRNHLDPTILLLALQCARYYIGVTQAVFTELLGLACYSVASKYIAYEFSAWKAWRKLSDETFTFKRLVQETRAVFSVCAGMLHCDFLPRCNSMDLKSYLLQQFLEPKFTEPKVLVQRGNKDTQSLRGVLKLMKHVAVEFGVEQ
jgi:serine/threonine protein kinase